MLATLVLLGILPGSADAAAETDAWDIPAGYTVYDLAADDEGGLYLAAGSAVLYREAGSDTAEVFRTTEDCRSVAWADGTVYAADGGTAVGYRAADGTEIWRIPLTAEDASLHAMGGFLLATARTGSRIITAGGATAAMPAADGAQWALPLPAGEMLLGWGRERSLGNVMCSNILGNRRTYHDVWVPILTDACTPDGCAGDIYYLCGTALGMLDVENQTYRVLTSLPEGEYTRLACGGGRIYALDAAGGRIAEISPDSLEPETVRTLTLAMNGLPQSYLARSIQDYMHRNPGVRIETVSIESNALWSQTASGTAEADLVLLESYMNSLPNLWATGKLTALEDFGGIAAAVTDERFLPESLQPVTVDGHLAGIPVRLAVPVLFADREAMETAGIALPDNDWDWAAFLDWARELETEDGSYAMAFRDGLRYPAFMDDYIASYVDETGWVDFDTDTFRTLMEKWKALYDAGYFGGHAGDALLTETGLAVSTATLATWFGDMAMSEDVFLAMPTIDGAHDRLASRPVWLAIPAGSTQKEWAADFLAFLLDYDQAHSLPLADSSALLHRVEKDTAYPAAEYEMDTEAEDFFRENLYGLYEDTMARTAPLQYAYPVTQAVERVTARYIYGHTDLETMVREMDEAVEDARLKP